MRNVIGSMLVTALFVLAGCTHQTEFRGPAQYPGGPRACWDECARAEMEMAGFVFVGRYSTACVCAPRHAGATASNEPAVAGALAAATVGAEVQRRNTPEGLRIED